MSNDDNSEAVAHTQFVTKNSCDPGEATDDNPPITQLQQEIKLDESDTLRDMSENIPNPPSQSPQRSSDDITKVRISVNGKEKLPQEGDTSGTTSDENLSLSPSTKQDRYDIRRERRPYDAVRLYGREGMSA